MDPPTCSDTAEGVPLFIVDEEQSASVTSKASSEDLGENVQSSAKLRESFNRSPSPSLQLSAHEAAEITDHHRDEAATMKEKDCESNIPDYVPSAVPLELPTPQRQEDEVTTRHISGLKQLAALSEKNMIAKIRTPVSTFLEVLAPVALSALLVVGYLMATVLNIESKQYSNLTFDVPGFVLPTALGAIAGFTESASQRNQSNYTVAGANTTTNGTQPLSTVSPVKFSNEMYDLLTHPLPIPTITQFVALATAMKAAVGNISSSEVYQIIQQSDYFKQFGNLLDLGTLHLAPRGYIVDNFVQYVNDTYPSILSDASLLGNVTQTNSTPLQIRIHDRAEDALLYINQNVEEPTWAFIDMTNSFPSASAVHSSDELVLTKSDLNNVTFTLRMNYTTIPNTSLKTIFVSRGLNTLYQRYYLSGFLTLQRTLEDFAFAQAASVLSQEDPTYLAGQCELPSPLRTWSMPMPTPDYDQNTFFTAAGYLLGLVMAMGFLYPMSRLVKSLVEEKELRLKETLQILGVKPWAYWLSWVLVAYLLFLVDSVLVTLVLHSSVMKYSTIGYVFALIGLFCSATIGFSFFIAAFFSRAKLAAIMGPLALFATIMPRWIFYGTNRYENTDSKIWASLLPGTAMSFGADIIADYELVKIGVHSWNASEGAYSYNTCLVMMAFDTVLYMFLGWYLEQVLPSTYGVRQPFYFFLMPSYWGCSRRKIWSAEDSGETPPSGAEAVNFEVVSPECGSPKVQINNLVKRYKKNGPNAVDNLNLSLYESQITCLLGHNGAGKSSAISVATGLFPATSGECTIYGHPVSTELEKARQSLGLCPQHNILFAELTVAEHLRMFEKIKGMNPTFESIQKRANDVGIGDKLNTLSGQLSGGMKRKLSIAIALCGDPKFILLDEPTSGMDPYSRRATWDLLRRSKYGRVILLTTHFMDEAEVLSDRIAVMKTGQLQCCGSALFLKRRFGLGYSLTVVLDTNSPANHDGARSVSAVPASELTELENGFGPRRSTVTSQLGSKTEQQRLILAFLMEFVPGTSLVRHSGREITFRFPNGFEDQFPALFDAFEEGGMRERLGIGGYGVSNTSLEEVFLRLAEASPEEQPGIGSSVTTVPDENSSLTHDCSNGKLDSPEQCGPSESKKLPVAINMQASGNNHQYLGFAAQISALLRKRFLVQRRDIKGFVFMIILPAVVVALVMLILTIKIPLAGPPIPLSLELYKDLSFGNGDKTFSVPFGGGAPFQAERPVNTSAGQLEGLLSTGVPFADFYEVPDVNSSDEMSSYLLRTYNSRSHAPRLGSFVVDDRINLQLNVNWDKLWSILNTTDILRMIGFASSQSTRQLQRQRIPSANNVLENGTLVELIALWLQENAADISMLFDQRNQTENFDPGLLQQYLQMSLQNSLMSQENGAGTSKLLDQQNQTESFDPGLLQRNLQTSLQNVSMPNIVADLLPIALWLRENAASISMLFEQLNQTESFDPGLFQQYLQTSLQNISMSNIGADLLSSMSLRGKDTYFLGINANISILHNASSPHGVAVFNHEYARSRYKECTGNNGSSFIIVNHPLPVSTEKSLEIRTVLSVMASFFILIPFCFVPSAFVVFVVREKACKSKHVQLVSGVNLSSLWIATYIWDLLMYSILAALIMVIFALYGAEAAQVFVGDTESFFATFLIIFGYGFSALPFAYLTSRNFENHSSAQIAVLGIFFVTGFVAANAYFIMNSIESTKTAAAALRPIFRLWPAYNVGDGLISLSSSFLKREVLGEDSQAFDWDVTGISIFLLFALSVPYFLLLLLLEYSDDGGSGGFVGRVLRKLRGYHDDLILKWNGVRKNSEGVLVLDDGLDSDSNSDADVTAERNRVMQNVSELKSSAEVLIVNLWKVYPPSVSRVFRGFKQCLWCLCCCCSRRERPVDKKFDTSSLPKRAIRGVTVAIEKGETFGLLGVNGAGKTTTMAILTGDTNATSGQAYIAGYDVTGRKTGEVAEARKHIGFCPQIDPLLDLMTGREALRMFGSLRGIPSKELNSTVDRLMDALTLTPHADKPAETYSGGNKRKLSLGIALIGGPEVLLIDEASSGMDPAARRKIWDLIEQVSENRSVVLTTHSMEEAEALCTRLTIMVGGRMRCLGSVQHLKSKYLGGYTLDLQLRTNASPSVSEGIRSHVLETALPSASLVEQHGLFLRFSIPRTSSDGVLLRLGDVFRELAAMKADTSMMVQEYSLTQSTLEQVFLQFAKDGDTGFGGHSE